MITIEFDEVQEYSDERGFEYFEIGTIRFEYSLLAIYKWESIWKKPFLSSVKNLTVEEQISFFECMAIDELHPKVRFDVNHSQQLIEYILDEQTATTFSTNTNNQNDYKRPKVYTSEEIYALMAEANIPLEFEVRNLNRLLIILKIVSLHNSPPKKMSREDIYQQNAKINAERKAQMKTKR